MLRDLYDQHVTDQQREHGEFDAHTAEATRNLGPFLRGHSDRAAVYTALSGTVAIDEKVFGPNAPRTLADVAGLATVVPRADAPKLFERAAGSSDAAAAPRALVALGELRVWQDDRERSGPILASSPREAGSRFAKHCHNPDRPCASDRPRRSHPAAAARPGDRPQKFRTSPSEMRHRRATVGGSATGKAAEAEPSGRGALDVLSEKLGPDHPRTAAAASTLASILRTNGKFAKAEGLYRQALAVDEAVLGPQDPGTLDTVRALADLWRDRGRKEEATVLERRLILNVRSDVARAS